MNQNKTRLSAENTLPTDFQHAVLVGRAWRPDRAGPAVVTVRDRQLIDITSRPAPTVSELFALDDPVGYVRGTAGEKIAGIDEILANSEEEARDIRLPWLLAPTDLQALKAAGVTFITSLLERVIEEQAHGSPEKGAGIRADLEKVIGSNLASLKPGSDEAKAMKDVLTKRGLWSQYLEVGIGPDAEVFTKGQPLSAVGTGAFIGIRSDSTWNNPEPEIVLAVSGAGHIIGASLGNDVNLRDFEGRSALLLPRAKDNNASCSIGPFVRLLDDQFSLDDIRQAQVDLRVEGDDGFVLTGSSSMSKISRDPSDLVRATVDNSHQYPDGFMLMLGTMFVPVQNRGEQGKEFTHKPGDVVTVSTARIGKLRNQVRLCSDCSPWTFGVSSLMRNLAGRGLL